MAWFRSGEVEMDQFSSSFPRGGIFRRGLRENMDYCNGLEKGSSGWSVHKPGRRNTFNHVSLKQNRQLAGIYFRSVIAIGTSFM
jgi:hypothetical protein